jgi:anti-sigma factor RsiW
MFGRHIGRHIGRHLGKELSAYAHGELNREAASRVASHLEDCARCRAEFDTVKSGIRLAESLPPRQAPAALWDDIESALADATRHAGPTRHRFVELRRATPGHARPRRLLVSWLPSWRRVAVACSLLAFVACAGALWLYRGATRPAWSVASLAGAPTVERGRIGKGAQLSVGEWLETDANSRAELQVANIGRIEVDPGSRLRLVATKLSEHRVELAHGRMSARIWAPPRLFFVDTPSAVAADLGCAYTLQVDDRGRGLLRVTSGWVALEAQGRESVVPQGASCATQPGAAPGTPYFEDATDDFKAALSRFDFDGGGAGALAVVLKESRPRDTLTLWHLLARASGDDRARVYDRLAQLAPPPAGVTREGALSLDRHMLDAWKDALEANCFDVKCGYLRGAWHNVKDWLRKHAGGE